MIKKGDTIQVNVETLAYGGEGIARHDGMAIFIPESVPGDKLEIEIISVKKSYAKGIIKQIIEPSPCRIEPVCALAKVCGGCQWQYIDYNEQLRAKRQIVEDNFKKIAHMEIPVKDVIPGEYNLEYRCKIQLPIQQTKVSKRILAGYYKKGTHELVNIKYCPIQPKIINEITQFIREKAQELGIWVYKEKTRKGLLRHLVYRYSQTNKNLLVILVINSEKIPDDIKNLCRMVKDKFPEVIGTLANFNTANSNVIIGTKNEIVCGKDFIEEDLEGKKFKISADSFFQVNPATAVKMFNEVKKVIREKTDKPEILDVYAGVGSFSIWIKELASKITAVEENPNATRDAEENIKLNPAGAEIEILEGSADDVLLKLEEQNKKFDVTILDPPRKGCTDTVLNATANLTKDLIIYISCNPATLARDVKHLSDLGFTPEYVQPVDMFCHTYHIESIVVLKKAV